MMCHLFESVQFDFEEGNFRSGFEIELLSFAICDVSTCAFEIKGGGVLYKF